MSVFWGDHDGGASPAMWDHEVDLGEIDGEAFSVWTPGLIHGVPYYYRLRAANDFETRWSEPFKFTSLDLLNQESASAWLTSTNRSDGSNVLNADASVVSLAWTSNVLNPALFDHQVATEDQLTVLEDGDYFTAFTLLLINTNQSVGDRRTGIRAELYVDGVAQGDLGAVGESTYIRGYINAAGGHYHGSAHFAGLLTNISAGSTIEVRVGSTASSNGDVLMEQASLYLDRVNDVRPVFAAVTTDGGQDMTPNSARTVAWEEIIRNAPGLALINATDIVLENPGTYRVF
ncbi:MAG: hypothetical protein AAF492_25395, partial [Verrucomicrobiota bacterium]